MRGKGGGIGDEENGADVGVQAAGLGGLCKRGDRRVGG